MTHPKFEMQNVDLAQYPECSIYLLCLIASFLKRNSVACTHHS